MTQVCEVLGALKAAQEAVIRAAVPEVEQLARERFYDAAAAYDESHGDDPIMPTCRVCAEALAVGGHWSHDETCATGGFCSCRDEVHTVCALVCIECGLPVGDDAHWPHEESCGGIEDPSCMCNQPSCSGCCTDPECQVDRFRQWVLKELGGHPSTAALFGFAQYWEEIADSHGCDPVRYGEADLIFQMALDAEEAERGRHELETGGQTYECKHPERLR